MEPDAGQKAHCKIECALRARNGLSQADDPQQGARLVRAFLRITDPRVRLAIIHMVEKMSLRP